MDPHPMAVRTARALGADPTLAFDLFLAACEVWDDFEEFGPVLQSNEDGEYSAETAIMRLNDAKERLKKLVDKP